MRPILPAIALILFAALSQAQDNATTPPSILVRNAPEYSAEAARARVQSTVVLSITVGEDGKAHDVQVANGAGFGLDEKAIEAMGTWVFQPATKNGVSVPFPANVELNFNLVVKDKDDRTGQNARLNFTLPPDASRPVLITGTLPGNPAAKGDQSVKYHMQVDAQGVPKNVAVLQSTDPVWQMQVLRVVLGWRFRPAVVNGTPVLVEGVFEIAHSGSEDEPEQITVTQSGGDEDETRARHAPAPLPVAGLTPRGNHTATRLANGTVLLAGGATPGTGSHELASAQIFDPATRMIAKTGDMLTARQNHTATLLPDGKVLIAGGEAGGRAFASAEIFDPSTGTFSRTAGLHEARQSHAAALLPDGRVLICGGAGAAGTALDSTEIFDPGTKTFLSGAHMTTARRSFAAVTLKNGKVLLAGGDATGAAAEIFDPTSGTFEATGKMTMARSGFGVALLESGQVLVAGGSRGSGSGELAGAELFDIAANAFHATGSMAGGRDQPVLVTLDSGKVLVTGGFDPARGGPVAQTEIYDPRDGTFSSGPLPTGLHIGHTATLLEDGSVLVAGGLMPLNGSGAELLVIR